ncbi:MAG: TIM barrel protein [Verrucomicrobiota bacterium]
MAEIISGLVSITFRKLSPPEIVDLCQQAELQVIEWGGDMHVPHGDLAAAKTVACMTADAGLSVSAYGSYYRAGVSEHDGLSFELVLETAQALGAPCIRVWSGNLGSEKADGAYRKWVVEELQRIAALAASADIRVTLECHRNTLTDTYISARSLLDEVGHANCLITWQPHQGQDVIQSMEGLRSVLPELFGLHVFHWGLSAAERYPLEHGIEDWMSYLEIASDREQPVLAQLEFVRNDDPRQLLQDAKQLRNWIDALQID